MTLQQDFLPVLHWIKNAELFDRPQTTLTVVFAMQFEENKTLLIRIYQGKVITITQQNTALASWDFCITSSFLVWEKFWKVVPEPGWHDIFALRKNGRMQIQGNLYPLMVHLSYFKELFSLGRLS